MDEHLAWKSFYSTGKIQDYIRYAQVKNHRSHQGEAARVGTKSTGAVTSTGEKEEQCAGQNPGTYYPGTGYR